MSSYGRSHGLLSSVQRHTLRISFSLSSFTNSVVSSRGRSGWDGQILRTRVLTEPMFQEKIWDESQIRWVWCDLLISQDKKYIVIETNTISKLQTSCFPSILQLKIVFIYTPKKTGWWFPSHLLDMFTTLHSCLILVSEVIFAKVVFQSPWPLDHKNKKNSNWWRQTWQWSARYRNLTYFWQLWFLFGCGFGYFWGSVGSFSHWFWWPIIISIWHAAFINMIETPVLQESLIQRGQDIWLYFVQNNCTSTYSSRCFF